MTPEQAKVLEFHQTFMPELIPAKPEIPDFDTQLGIYDAIREELDELDEAMMVDDLVAAADAIGDLLYVVYRAAVLLGLDAEPIFNEVHRSNMTKEGGYKNELGKWVKPSTYTPPNLEPIIEAQRKENNERATDQTTS